MAGHRITWLAVAVGTLGKEFLGQFGEDQFGGAVSFFQVGIAGKDEAFYTQINIFHHARHHLIGVTDQGSAGPTTH